MIGNAIGTRYSIVIACNISNDHPVAMCWRFLPKFSFYHPFIIACHNNLCPCSPALASQLSLCLCSHCIEMASIWNIDKILRDSLGFVEQWRILFQHSRNRFIWHGHMGRTKDTRLNYVSKLIKYVFIGGRCVSGSCIVYGFHSFWSGRLRYNLSGCSCS